MIFQHNGSNKLTKLHLILRVFSHIVCFKETQLSFFQIKKRDYIAISLEGGPGALSVHTVVPLDLSDLYFFRIRIAFTWNKMPAAVFVFMLYLVKVAHREREHKVYQKSWGNSMQSVYGMAKGQKQSKQTQKDLCP